MTPILAKSLGITTLAVMLVVSGHAIAEGETAKNVEARLTAAVKEIQEACEPDVKKFCSSVTPGEGRLLMCMMAYEDQISSKCDYALYQVSRNLERAGDRLEMTAEACWDDIEKHCANIPEGAGRIAQCLVTKKASLTKICSAMIDKFPRK
jgi:hypothetical protein